MEVKSASSAIASVAMSWALPYRFYSLFRQSGIRRPMHTLWQSGMSFVDNVTPHLNDLKVELACLTVRTRRYSQLPRQNPLFSRCMEFAFQTALWCLCLEDARFTIAHTFRGKDKH